MQPFRCPVCEGRGFVRAGFYNTAGDISSSVAIHLNPAPCRTCDGTGVLWHNAPPVDAVVTRTVEAPPTPYTGLPSLPGFDGSSLARTCPRCGGWPGKCVCYQTTCGGGQLAAPTRLIH